MSEITIKLFNGAQKYKYISFLITLTFKLNTLIKFSKSN